MDDRWVRPLGQGVAPRREPGIRYRSVGILLGLSVMLCWSVAGLSGSVRPDAEPLGDPRGNIPAGGASLAADASSAADLRWVAFAPSNFDPGSGIFPDTASIRADLERAHDHGFDGVISFAANGTLGQIPRIAREVGFRGVIMGLFLFDETQRLEELENARAAAQFVDGYSVGNEGLIGCGGERYTVATLLATMVALRNATAKPVTTSEQIEDYLDGGCLGGWLLRNGDWLFPIIHPFNNGIRDPAAGMHFTVDRVRQLNSLSAKAVFVKETGWPTGGDAAATEENQERYFLLLKGNRLAYAYFEAFDQPFKATPSAPWEPFWGLFRPGRIPKLFSRRNQP